MVRGTKEARRVSDLNLSAILEKPADTNWARVETANSERATVKLGRQKSQLKPPTQKYANNGCDEIKKRRSVAKLVHSGIYAGM